MTVGELACNVALHEKAGDMNSKSGCLDIAAHADHGRRGSPRTLEVRHKAKK